MSGLTVDGSGFQRYSVAMQRVPAVLKTEVARGLNGLLSSGVVMARGYAPVESGKLRGAIRILEPVSVGDLITGTYGVTKGDVIYAFQREYGGTISAKNGGYLIFRHNGRFVKVRSVTQKGSHYMSQSTARIRPLVPPTISRAVSRALATVGG